MEPELRTGDFVLVNKLAYGPRLFNLFASLRGEQVEIYRAPGFSKVRRNDVVVFNFPHPKDWGKIEMHIMKYYIKRCVALPGDTFQIENGINRVSGFDKPVGNLNAQKRIARKEAKDFIPAVLNSFPFNSQYPWSIKNFGPLYVPKAGDEIKINQMNYPLYKKIIEWEQHAETKYEDSLLYIDGKISPKYQFRKNYFLMAGDHAEDSQDSRYWGFLPEEYIVGKAWIIWKSEDPYTHSLNWQRFMKKIQ